MSDDPVKGLRLLVLEDEMMVLILVEDMLVELGCTVIGPASGVAAALQLVADEEIEAALLDVNLGHGEHGYTVADELVTRGIPFAFVTGYGAESLPEFYRGRPTLQKPFHMAGLRRVVTELAEARREAAG
jgi:CheY-like chemotaxis protein